MSKEEIRLECLRLAIEEAKRLGGGNDVVRIAEIFFRFATQDGQKIGSSLGHWVAYPATSGSDTGVQLQNGIPGVTG